MFVTALRGRHHARCTLSAASKGLSNYPATQQCLNVVLCCKLCRISHCPAHTFLTDVTLNPQMWPRRTNIPSLASAESHGFMTGLEAFMGPVHSSHFTHSDGPRVDSLPLRSLSHPHALWIFAPSTPVPVFWLCPSSQHVFVPLPWVTLGAHSLNTEVLCCAHPLHNQGYRCCI